MLAFLKRSVFVQRAWFVWRPLSVCHLLSLLGPLTLLTPLFVWRLFAWVPVFVRRPLFACRHPVVWRCSDGYQSKAQLHSQICNLTLQRFYCFPLFFEFGGMFNITVEL
ncbi:hypothetical protein XENORESO_015548 [Xenotaenia resolanae]|uniref:Secreted protein n=1 Tax=Xenotaenia resolanae TaxID=208358 RepID=A0ABV0WF39_9TELE